jgi:hypothetical protein
MDFDSSERGAWQASVAWHLIPQEAFSWRTQMPGFDRDQAAIDNTVENRQLGSVMLTAGWILLWMNALLFIYFFISIRDGSLFWPIWLAIEGVIGLVLVIMGTRYRRAVGVTRLGRREMALTARQQAQDEDEQRHVR